MAIGDRQRRDGSAKRVQLTSGDHGGPKGKKKAKKPRNTPLSGQQSKAAELRRKARQSEAGR